METPDTKTRLLDAAASVFLAQGFANASLEMVRLQAGVSNGSLYHHFPNKSVLADALYAHTLRDVHAFMLAPISAQAPAEEGVKGLVQAYVQWVLKNPDRARLLNALRATGALADAPHERGETNAKAFAALAQWVLQHTAAGRMRAMPQPVWMALVFSPVMALAPHWLKADTPKVSPQVRTTLAHAAWMAIAP
jgi:AcrR family transcriptional regulator